MVSGFCADLDFYSCFFFLVCFDCGLDCHSLMIDGARDPNLCMSLCRGFSEKAIFRGEISLIAVTRLLDLLEATRPASFLSKHL